MKNIKVIKAFLSNDEALLFKDMIDSFEIDYNDKFGIWQDGKRIALSFGNVEKDALSGVFSFPDLQILKDKEELVVRSLMSRVLDAVVKNEGIADDLYVTSLWLAKQYAGAFVPEHEDTDNGVNTHFEYSLILYLNNLNHGGELYFPVLNETVIPSAGDLVYFPSQSTGTHTVRSINEERYSVVFWLTKDKSQSL
jgi:hypothetical protein